ncbi:hypothetical protein BC830DRAFT_1168992 [Chytriomyces sp. MP71]|nr:hypothetical protein BC830DRAFT_1168992 [Chytriomyces sp. MP71]
MPVTLLPRLVATRGSCATVAMAHDRGLIEMAAPLSRGVATPSELLASHPVRLCRASARDRQRYFALHPAHSVSTRERWLVAPLRLRLARMAGARFLDTRVDPGFFPSQFQRGVQRALPTLFETLSTWNGSRASRKGIALQQMLAPPLLAHLQHTHAALHASGHTLHLNWRYLPFRWSHERPDDSPVHPTHIWLTFGEPALASSTLLAGPLSHQDGWAIHTRRVAQDAHIKPLKQRRVFREICFEYVYRPHDLPEQDLTWTVDGTDILDSLLSFQTKRDIMDMGTRVGIDSTVSGGLLDYVLTRNVDGVVVASGELDMDGMGVRMESTHFVDEFPDEGKWRVADLDDYFVSQRVEEEDRGVAVSP